MTSLPIDPYVRYSKPSDIDAIADRLRAIDVKEMLAMDPTWDPKTVLEHTMEMSAECFTGRSYPSHIPVCMFGCGKYRRVAPSRALQYLYLPVWFLATDMLYYPAHATRFLRNSKRWVEYFYSNYGCIGNEVLCTNIGSLRWLRGLGFRSIACREVNGHLFETYIYGI